MRLRGMIYLGANMALSVFDDDFIQIFSTEETSPG